MPQTPERKAQYQRERRFKPHRDQYGDFILEPGTGEDHEHYWGHVSKAKPGTRVCLEFMYQGRMIGGCGMVKRWEGKLLDGGMDLSAAIANSPMAKEIHQKMPVTKGRFDR